MPSAELVVNTGITSEMVHSTTSAASAGPVPATWKNCSRCRSPPTRMQTPTTPLQMIITVAYSVSRGSVAVAAPPDSISDRISVTSMAVMASASTSVPKGSPTRCATTSA